MLPETEVCACIYVPTGAVTHYAPSEEIARRDVGTLNLPKYRFEMVKARVVFVVSDPEWGLRHVCLTYEAALRHRKGDDEIEVRLVSE